MIRGRSPDLVALELGVLRVGHLLGVGALADRQEVRVHPNAVAQDDGGELIAAIGVDRHRAGGLGCHVGRVGVDAHDSQLVAHGVLLAGWD